MIRKRIEGRKVIKRKKQNSELIDKRVSEMQCA